jgi:hypothetical protein
MVGGEVRSRDNGSASLTGMREMVSAGREHFHSGGVQ